MAKIDLDGLHKDRMRQLKKGMPRRGEAVISSIFMGEQVVKTISKPKVMIDGFRLDTILPLLPFSPVTYVGVCPACMGTEERTNQCIELLRSGLIVPVLSGRYSDLPDRLVDELKVRDHISAYEAAFFRNMQLARIADGNYLCSHCFGERTKSVIDRAKVEVHKKHFQAIKFMVEQTARNLKPPIFPDYEIMDAMEIAISERDGRRIAQLSHLSEVIKEIRKAQIWNSALPVSASDLEGAPSEISAEMDEGRLMSIGLHRLISEGLALRIPMDIPLPRYVEIVREFQPRISAVVSSIVDKAGRRGSGFDAMSREISRINNEIDRIKNLKRYLVVEAMAEPMRKNKSLLAATLVAGALGLGGSLVGCAGALAVGGAVKAAKRYKVGKKLLENIKENKPFAVLRAKVQSEIIQPEVDKVMARYLQTDLPAVTVLALRRDIAKGINSSEAQV